MGTDDSVCPSRRQRQLAVLHSPSAKVVGIFVVRNEVDIIETNRRYHFAGIIDEAIVMDNGSTDGTLQRLTGLSQDLPILLASEPGAFDQSAQSTRLAPEIDASEETLARWTLLRLRLRDRPGPDAVDPDQLGTDPHP